MTQTFGALLRHLRRKNGLTQEQLAQRLGYSRSMVAALETDRRMPQVDEIHTTFARALDLNDSRGSIEQMVELVARARPASRFSPIYPIPSASMHRAAEQTAEPRRVPMPPTRLYGRERELRDIRDRILYRDVRLVTLTGPPGVGKTTLALKAASLVQIHMANGACYVPLASITSADAVPSAILEALHAPQQRGAALDGLVAVLRRREMALVLDNFEQILDAAPMVARLLEECANVSILVTSRERLHLRAEQLIPVQPLPVKDALELFVARVAIVNPQMQTAELDPAMCKAICRRLDCLPLAIELCAAQADFALPQQILAQLQSRSLEVLVDGSVDLPPRQRTLRAAIDSSYRLLNDAEASLLQALSVFVGGCTPAMAEEAWTDDPVAATQTARTLRSLASKSLIRLETTEWGDQRIQMLESVREFSRERLEEDGRLAAVRMRHFNALSRHMRHGESLLSHEESKLWLKRILIELDNLHVALQWAYEHAQWGAIAMLLCMLTDALEHSPRQQEFAIWHERLYPAVDVLDADLAMVVKIRFCYESKGDAARGQIPHILHEYRSSIKRCRSPLIKAYALYWGTGLGVDYPDSMEALRQAIDLARCGDESDESTRAIGHSYRREIILPSALFMYGCELFNRGETVESEALLRESIALRRDLHLFDKKCWNLGYLARVALRKGNIAESEALVDAAIEDAENYENMKGLATWRAFRGHVLHHAGRFAESRRQLERSWADGCEYGDPFTMQIPAIYFADLALEEGNTVEGRKWLAEAIGLAAVSSHELDWRPIHRAMLAARLAAMEGRDERAAQLYGVMQAYDDRIKIGPTGPVIDTAAPDMAQVRERMGDAAYRASCEVGRRLPTEATLATLLD